MSENTEEKKEFNIHITVTADNVSYESDMRNPDTIFWLETVKNIILNKII